jgi:hypothetical protein
VLDAASDWSPVGLYTYAAGDFLLAAKEAWHRIRGFWENPRTFTHLDSYACHQLDAIGLEQALLMPPCMVFHADHSRAVQANRMSIANEDLLIDLRKLRDGQLSPVFNGSDWGQADFDLKEVAIGSALL